MKPTYSSFPFLTIAPRSLPPTAALASAPQPDAPAAEAAGPQHLQELLAQSPVAMCLLLGPTQLIDLVNQPAAAGWGYPADELRGKPFFEALPNLRGQGYEAAYATVWQTRQGVTWREAPVTMLQNPGGQAVLGYYDVSFQPFYSWQGRLTGILMTSQEVTEQVLARQHAHQATDELAATTAGLADYVAELTHAAHAAQEDAEGRATLLAQLLEQAPVAIGLLVGADYVVELCNPALQALWGCTLAQVQHRPLFEGLPALQGQGLRELLAQVGRTGEPAAAAPRPGPGAAGGLLYYPLRAAQGHLLAIAAVAAAGLVAAAPPARSLP